MAQNPLGPPPPVKQDAVFDRWIRMVYQRIASAGQIIWSQIDFTGSTLTDLVTRNHADLQNLNTASYTHLTSANHTDLTDGGATTLHKHDHAAQDNLNSASYYHLTQANHTDLTDGGDSTLHYHSADRDSANFTGTNWTDLTDAGDSTLHYHASDRSIANTTGLGTGVGTALAVNIGSAGAPVLFDGAGGTPTSLTLTNATGLPAAGVSGTALVAAAIGTTVQAYDADLTTWAGITPGTNVGTALAVNVGSAGAIVVNGGALGTPASGTVTNLTGTASININGTVGATIPAAGTFTDLTSTGNTTLGNAAGDTLTINAGTWEIGSDFATNRDWGTAPASGYVPAYFYQTGEANASQFPIYPWLFDTLLTGANDPGYVTGLYGSLTLETTGGSTAGMGGFYGEVGLLAAASGTYKEISGSAADVYFTGATTAVVTYANSYSGDGVYFFSTGGTVTNSAGFRAQPAIGHASKITNGYGFIAEHITPCATLTVGFESQQNSGTGVWGFRASGTANNAFAGNVRIGSNVAPTVPLDVTGNALVSGTLNKITFTAPATAATLTLTNNTTVTGPAASGTIMTLGNTETATGIKNFAPTNTTTQYNCQVAGTNTDDIDTIYGFSVATTMSGGATTNVMRLFSNVATFSPAASGMNNYTNSNIATYNSATPPATHTGVFSRVNFGASQLGGTVTSISAFSAGAPSINAAATTNIGTYAQFTATNITQGAGQTITAAIGFFGGQASGTGRWNCYMNGTANNAFRGNTRFGGVAAPVATVDITGTLSVSGNTTLGDAVADTTTVSGNLILPKTSGYGIKVDTATPTFPWHDILGPISIRGIDAADPSYNTYQGSIRGYQFDAGEEAYVEFHIPHDYVPGSDIYIHAHWSVKLTTTAGVATNAVTGGSVTWGFEVTYAKGHNQAAFITPVTATVAQNASTTQYQHMIAEVQLSAASPTASQIDSDNLEVDGLILVRAYLSANNITVSTGSVPAPFLHMVDIHYQSTNIGTKQKAPNFYT